MNDQRQFVPELSSLEGPFKTNFKTDYLKEVALLQDEALLLCPTVDKSKWTMELLFWEDGDYSLSIFHTFVGTRQMKSEPVLGNKNLYELAELLQMTDQDRYIRIYLHTTQHTHNLTKNKPIHDKSYTLKTQKRSITYNTQESLLDYINSDLDSIRY